MYSLIPKNNGKNSKILVAGGAWRKSNNITEVTHTAQWMSISFSNYIGTSFRTFIFLK
jgi:hypothetical protein